MGHERRGCRKLEVDSENAEILGQAMTTITASKYRDGFEDVIAKHEIEKIDVEKWYPVEDLLNFYRDLSENENAMSNLVSIGIEVFETAKLPGEVDTIPAGLEMLQAINDLNLRNMPEDDGYDVTKIGERHMRVIDRTPWPHDLIYGYLYGIARRLKPEDGHPIVERTYLVPDDPNADGAVYDITW